MLELLSVSERRSAALRSAARAFVFSVCHGNLPEPSNISLGLTLAQAGGGMVTDRSKRLPIRARLDGDAVVKGEVPTVERVACPLVWGAAALLERLGIRMPHQLGRVSVPTEIRPRKGSANAATVLVVGDEVSIFGRPAHV